MVSPQPIANCWRHVGICPPQYFPPSSLAPLPIHTSTPLSIFDQRLAHTSGAQSILGATLSALDETRLTEHESTDKEIVDQLIAERELAQRIYDGEDEGG